MIPDLHRLVSRLGVPKVNLDLLQVALTHRSVLNEDPTAREPYERLEFLGDAVIELAASEYLYKTFPDRAEGQLTTLRAAVVRASCLARVAHGLGLGTYIRVSKGEDSAGGRTKTRLLAAALEATVGAIYLDLGWRTARSLVNRLLIPELEELLSTGVANPGKDPKSLLQELAQSSMGTRPTYRVLAATGPDHAKEFEVEVKVGDQISVLGKGRSRQKAEQAAAEKAMQEVTVNSIDERSQ